jgi:ABC-type cobalamin/Fe3+-siderophores transport system ATPase subunit
MVSVAPEPAVPPALAAHGLGFTYPRQPAPALADVDVSASAGELVFVLGPNGSGKSTLFKLLLGVLDPARGGVRIAGEDLRRLSARAVARRVAYIPQQEQSSFNYTAWQTVLMGRTPHLRGVNQNPGPADIAAAKEAMAELRIEHLAEKGLRTMSGGERQLVMIARALAQQTPMMILDEPTSALDFGNQALVLDHLRQLADSGLLVLVSSHNPMHALQHADRILLLRGGRILGSGAPEDIGEAELSALYDTPLRIVTSPEVPGLRMCIADPAAARSRRSPR